jgi:hypothetical protein
VVDGWPDFFQMNFAAGWNGQARQLTVVEDQVVKQS